MPTSATRQRITELGYGSGPWTRAELSETWGPALANKVIDEAKDFGWLISPYRGEFYVPPARDLMVAAWLPPAQRHEFVISRSLSATGLRYWCFSAWARRRGLLFTAPLFVTDLQPSRGPSRKMDAPLHELIKLGQQKASRVKKAPYLENTIIVPLLGDLSSTPMRAWVSLAAKPKKKPPKEVGDSWPGSLVADDMATGGRFGPTYIDYSVGRALEDRAWLIAFLNALNLPRIHEAMRTLAAEETGRDAQDPPEETAQVLARATRWSAYFGPPTPNEAWSSILGSGSFPYLLVPKSLWDESLSAATSRMYQDMTDLRRDLGA